MVRPITVENLLRQRKVEFNRIEFKKIWDLDGIFYSTSAFANEFNNIRSDI